MNHTGKLLLAGCVMLLACSNAIIGSDFSYELQDTYERSDAGRTSAETTDGDVPIEFLYPAMCEPVDVDELRTRRDYTQVATVATPASFTWKSSRGKTSRRQLATRGSVAAAGRLQPWAPSRV